MQAALSGGRALLQDGADPPRADTALGVGSGVIALAVIGFLCALTCLLGTKTTSSGAISLASALVFGASLLILLQVSVRERQEGGGGRSRSGRRHKRPWAPPPRFHFKLPPLYSQILGGRNNF